MQLVQEEDGTVTGAIGKQKDGSYVKLNATKGVVLAAGDYMNNESMVDRNLRDAAMFPLCLVNHTGDGHILGILAGGRMAPLGHARQIHTNYIGPFMFYPFLALDVHGKRFCNETIPMSSLNISMSATYKPEDRGIHFRIFDSKTEGAVEGIPGVPPVALVGEGSAWMDPETVVSGNTLEELCEAAGIPVADGVASIERYNELCAKGCDDDFGVAGSDMAAIDTPPFFCIKGDVGMSGINAGIMVDNRYRVIDTEGAPIPGLYAAGIQAGNPCGGINWNMPGGFSNSHIFTAGRYTVIHALTGDMTPAHPASFEDLADSFVGEDGGYAWDSPLCATAITVW
ncbi:MAG: FAD-binding protein [Adlercreutzia equolifaciens]